MANAQTLALTSKTTVGIAPNNIIHNAASKSNTSKESNSSRNQRSYEEIKKQRAERLKNLRAEKDAQIDEVLLFTDGMKSTHPLCAADFIYAEDFIGEADFAHPTG